MMTLGAGKYFSVESNFKAFLRLEIVIVFEVSLSNYYSLFSNSALELSNSILDFPKADFPA